MEKWKKLTGLAEKVRLSGKIWLLAGLFCAGLILAGGRAFFGAYPLGLAAAVRQADFWGQRRCFSVPFWDRPAWGASCLW